MRDHFGHVPRCTDGMVSFETREQLPRPANGVPGGARPSRPMGSGEIQPLQERAAADTDLALRGDNRSRSIFEGSRNRCFRYTISLLK
jgi:hypothetical protein